MQKLHTLIHSLSPSEKRYFKLFAQRQVQNKTTHYYKLFEAINQQSLYDENELLKKFRRESFVKHFAVTKNYLFGLILKSMQEYNEEHFVEWKIRNQYSQIKILASKGLDAETEHLIKKTKELAWQYEYYHIIMDILHNEKYLFGNFRIYEQSAEVFDIIVKEDLLAFELATVIMQCGHTWHLLTLLELEIGVVENALIKKQADALVAVAHMQQVPHTSYNAKFRYYATWSLYYNIINDQLKNYDCCKQCILIREEQISKQPLLNMDPLASYYNFLVSCEKANRWDDFEYYLNKTKDYPAPTIEINIRRMHNYCWCGLMYYLHQENYMAAKKIVDEYKAFFIDKKISYRKDFKLFIEACCGLVCFFTKDYTGAFKWWNEILNNKLPKIELRTQGAVRLYAMIAHWEENNFDMIPYLAAHAKKYLQSISMFHEAEELFISRIIKAANLTSKKNRDAALADLYKEMNEKKLSISGNAVNQYLLNWLKQFNV